MTQEGRRSGLLVVPVQACREAGEANPPGRNPERRERGKESTEVADPTLARKTSSEACGCPYRKPTQVGEERILRRAREPSSRNSAN